MFDADPILTNLDPVVTETMTADEFARAIFTPEGYAAAVEVQQKNSPSFAEYTRLVQSAVLQYAITIRQENGYAPLAAEDLTKLLHIAKIAMQHVEVLHTDDPVMIWGSPWDIRCTKPAQFVAYIAAFALENEERAVIFDREDAPEETDVRVLLDFITTHLPDTTYDQVIQDYLSVPEDEDEDFNVTGPGFVPDYIRSYFPAK